MSNRLTVEHAGNLTRSTIRELQRSKKRFAGSVARKSMNRRGKNSPAMSREGACIFERILGTQLHMLVIGGGIFYAAY
jgi:hypothetical protein